MKKLHWHSFTSFVTIKVEVVEVPLILLCYYYLECFETMKIINNEFDDLERKPHTIQFIQFVKAFCLQPNL